MCFISVFGKHSVANTPLDWVGLVFGHGGKQSGSQGSLRSRSFIGSCLDSHSSLSNLPFHRVLVMTCSCLRRLIHLETHYGRTLGLTPKTALDPLSRFVGVANTTRSP